MSRMGERAAGEKEDQKRAARLAAAAAPKLCRICRAENAAFGLRDDVGLYDWYCRHHAPRDQFVTIPPTFELQLQRGLEEVLRAP